MQVLVVILAIGGFIALIVWLGIKNNATTLANLHALAARHGFQVIDQKKTMGSERVVTGLQQNREVRFWSYTTGSGKSRQTWAAVGVRPRVAGLTFEIRRQGFTTKLMELFGAKEITVGDPAFDQAWFVKTDQPDLLRAALVPAIREKFMSQPKRSGERTYQTKDGLVQVAELGSFYSTELIARLEAKLPLLHDLADVVEVCSAEPR